MSPRPPRASLAPPSASPGKCSACSRAIVVDEVHDAFVEALASFTRGLAVGDPLSGDTFLGPVINERAVARFEDAAAAARRDGRIVAGGGRPELPGHFLEPTVVADLPRGHALTRDELFLPFVTVTRVASLDEALQEANDIDFGLAAGIFSTDDTEIEEYLDRIEAGVVYATAARARPLDRRLAGYPVLLRLEVQWHDGQGRPWPVLPRPVLARAVPHDRRLNHPTTQQGPMSTDTKTQLPAGARNAPRMAVALDEYQERVRKTRAWMHDNDVDLLILNQPEHYNWLWV